ncbi:NAD(P)(+) transhydrogenase (Re/Si-specific) subunit beta [Paraburkholderia ferrariae]|uniref:NAD(P)(+) transhydrogenase (Re/Si-specific) subunit beta n=1 Tax=Paraburkholderia ferrariae TaxID=386056 RepID=UPI0004887B54|nr:NAD(P)(+) transhydrogenase (Re/Si-specific) subunit beta [Paraburkholderia ferrariae]
MPEQLVGEVLWLGGSLLFAWLTCALAQLAVPAGGLSPGRAAARRGCARRDRNKLRYRVAFAICLALLLMVPPALLAAVLSRTAAAMAAAGLGAIAGLRLGNRWDLRSCAPAIALAAGLAGLAAMSGGFAGFLAGLERWGAQPGLRVALFCAVAVGAALLGAAVASFAGGGAQARSRAPFPQGGHAVHGVALLLCAVLGYGFVTAGASRQFGFSALVAAAVLSSALGVRLMTGGRRPYRLATAARFTMTPPQAVAGSGQALAMGAPLLTSLAGIPDELLVEACSGGSFEPGCLYGRTPGYDGEPSRARRRAGPDRPLRRRSLGHARGKRRGPH